MFVLPVVHEAAGDVGLLDVEVAIEDDEIGDCVFGDGAEIREAQFRGRRGRAQVRRVDE